MATQATASPTRSMFAPRSEGRDVLERADLDRQRGRGRRLARPRQRRVQVRRGDHVDPADVLLALGVRAVGDHAVGAYDRGAARGVQAAGEHPRAAITQLLVEPVQVGRDPGYGLSAGHAAVGLVDRKQVVRHCPPHRWEYCAMITPLVVATLPVSSNSVSGAGPSNSRAPLPRVSGQITRVSRSIRLAACRLRTSDALPTIPRSLSDLAFSSVTTSTASPRSRTEFCQASASCRVLETTYLVVAFMRVVIGLPSVRRPHAVMKSCQVRRPSSMSPGLAMALAISRPSTSSSYRLPQPPCVKPPRVSSSARPRLCTTPSRVTHIVTVIEPMDLLPSVPRVALPRPGHPLHERPPAKSTRVCDDAEAPAPWPALRAAAAAGCAFQGDFSPVSGLWPCCQLMARHGAVPPGRDIRMPSFATLIPASVRRWIWLPAAASVR